MNGSVEQSGPADVPWCNQILRLLQKIEARPDELDSVFDTSEPFLEKAWGEIARAMFPSARLNTGGTLSTYHVGTLVGHKHGYSQNLEVPMQRLEDSLKKIRDDSREIHEVFSERRKMLAKYERIARKITEKCLGVALKQTASETLEFFEGFTDALKTGSITEEGSLEGMGSTTLVCVLIAFNGAKIQEQFESVAQFHEALTVRFGSNTMGSLERTQKLCNRLQLRFGKPGRPRKAKNWDTN